MENKKKKTNISVGTRDTTQREKGGRELSKNKNTYDKKDSCHPRKRSKKKINNTSSAGGEDLARLSAPGPGFLTNLPNEKPDDLA